MRELYFDTSKSIVVYVFALADIKDMLDEVAVDATACDLITGFAIIDTLNARLTVAAGQFEARGGHLDTGQVSLRHWLTAHTRLGRNAGVVAVAARKLRSLPVTAAAWVSGALTGGQVTSIVTNVNDDNVTLFAEHEPALVRVITPLNPRDTARVMNQWRVYADDVTGKEPKPARGLTLTRTTDGTWRLDGHLDDSTGLTLHAALQTVATPPEPGDTSTPAQRRATGLGEILDQFLKHRNTKKRPRNHHEMVVVVNADDLDGDVCPGDTVTGTSVPTRLVEEWGCDADITRVVINSDSTIIDLGRRARVVNDDLFIALSVRDRGCRYPGCDRPVAWCDAHHLRHWRRYGPTNPDNLVLLCSRHHHIVHDPNWSITMNNRAEITIVTPQGRTLTSRPPPHRRTA